MDHIPSDIDGAFTDTAIVDKDGRLRRCEVSIVLADPAKGSRSTLALAVRGVPLGRASVERSNMGGQVQADRPSQRRGGMEDAGPHHHSERRSSADRAHQLIRKDE